MFFNVQCPGCDVEIIPVNAGGYKTFCEKCVEAMPTEDRISRIALILELTAEERDGLFFAAGKIPPEVIHAMKRNPRLFQVVRNEAVGKRGDR